MHNNETKRNKKGEGSIVKLNSGKYRAEINYLGADGKRKKKRSPAVKTKKEAELERKKLVTELEKLKGLNSSLDIDHYTVEEYFTQKYLPYKSDLKPQSYRRLESTIQTHIIPAHGYKIMSKITSNDIKALLNNMYDAGQSHSSIKKVYDAYSGMYKFATMVQRDIGIENNPMNAVKMIPQDKFEETTAVWLSNEQIAAFRAEAERKFKTGAYVYRYGLLFMLLINTGMREGEICALEKNDIDFKDKVIKITKGVNIVPIKQPDGSNKYEIKITTPKTRNSVRYIPMNENALRYAREIMAEFPNGNLLAYSAHETILRPDTLHKQFKRIVENAGLGDSGAHIHCLRHTFVSHMFDSGVDTQTIAEIIGDNEETVRKTYLHLFKSRKAKAVEMINIG